MSAITVENLLEQIEALPVAEQQRLAAQLAARVNGHSAERANGGPPPSSKPKPDFKYTKPIPMPDPRPSQQWMQHHAREYGGQWVALDGDRLIAHGEEAKAVFAAAKADGAYLPLVTYLPPADAPPFIGL